MPKLTKTFIDDQLARSKTYYLWDTQITGFGLKIIPSGKKTFVLKYRAGGGGRSAKQRWFKVGDFGSVTVEEARKQATILRAEIASGEDPQRQRQVIRDAATLKMLWARFEKEHLPKRKQSTSDDYKAMWRNHIETKYGNTKIKDISRREMIDLHRKISKTSPYAANRLVAMMSKLFNLAEKWEMCADGGNPCRHIERNPEVSRTRYLSTEEIKALGDSLRQGLALQEENHYMVAAIQLLLLTGARVSEILGTKWEWVDSDNRVINLPDSKTGAKQIYLSEPAIAIIQGLAQLPKSKGEPYVIRGRSKGRPFDNLRKVWRRVSTRAGISGARLHDLRHTAASIAVNSGFGLPIIGKLLGHSQIATTQRYAHVDTKPALVAINSVGESVESALGAVPTSAPRVRSVV